MTRSANIVISPRFLDQRIVPTKDTLGKYEKVTLVENDLFDSSLFPVLKYEVYMNFDIEPTCGVIPRVKFELHPL